MDVQYWGGGLGTCVGSSRMAYIVILLTHPSCRTPTLDPDRLKVSVLLSDAVWVLRAAAGCVKLPVLHGHGHLPVQGALLVPPPTTGRASSVCHARCVVQACHAYILSPPPVLHVLPLLPNPGGLTSVQLYVSA